MLDSREFRTVLASFATGVTVATAGLPDGSKAGVTINSFTSVSLDPPLVLFCLDRRALSYPVFSHASGYVISILADTQEDVARAFAVPGQGPERWQHGPFGTSVANGAPVLEKALATIECMLHQKHDAGDHTLFIGRVVSLKRQEGQPLLYWNSGYHHFQAVQ